MVNSPMSSGLIAEAAGLFAVTNFDDIVVLSLFFAQGAGEHGSARRVVAGQYLAFAVILAVAIGIAFGASFLPKEAIRYLGLIPITIGLRDAGKLWKNRQRGDGGAQAETTQGGPTVRKVAATTFGNGGDNIGVYVPVFDTVGTRGTISFAQRGDLILTPASCAASPPPATASTTGSTTTCPG